MLLSVSAPRRATLRDVAALAKVDASLVSRVINDDPKAGAAPETRQRIIDAVRQLDYRPNVVARGLRMARTWTMGVLVPSVTNPMYADVIAGAEGRAQELGYGVVFRTHVEGDREEIFTRLLQQGRVDGLIVASGLLRDAFIRRIASGDFGPVVLVNRRVNRVESQRRSSTTRPGPPLLSATCSTTATSTSSGLFGPPAIDTSRRRRSRILPGAAVGRSRNGRRGHARVGLPQRLRRDSSDLRCSPEHDGGVRVDDGDGGRCHLAVCASGGCPCPTTSRSSPSTTATSPSISTHH